MQWGRSREEGKTLFLKHIQHFNPISTRAPLELWGWGAGDG